MRTVVLFLALFSLSLAPVVLAQADCPAFLRTAIETVDSLCNATERNQACYGNITLNATPREGISDFQFEQPGDLVNIADINSLQLSSFNATDGQWGVALMRIQANLPATLPGQNVTFLLFGDVAVSDAGNQIVEVLVTAIGGVNVRQLPSTEATIIGSLTNGQEVTATGRLPDGSWVRILLDDDVVGWVSADFLSGDVDRLLSTEPSVPAFGPMQAFYFTTGVADAPCQQAPESGILIQTPQGAGVIQLRANNVDIALGSTVYLQAVAGDAMSVSVIEGNATLTAFGESQVVPAGTVSIVPLDDNGLASGAPEYPEPYDETALQALPLNMSLFEEVTVEAGISEANISAAIDIANGLPPMSGRWLHLETTTHIPLATCFDNFTLPVGHVIREFPLITFSENRSVMELPIPNTVYLYRTGESTYTGSDQGGDWTVIFTSPTTYIGNVIGWADYPDCSWDRELVGTYPR